MIITTAEYIEWDMKFRDTFGYGVPLFLIPPVETTDGLILNLKKCIAENKDLLREIYEVKEGPNIWY